MKIRSGNSQNFSQNNLYWGQMLFSGGKRSLGQSYASLVHFNRIMNILIFYVLLKCSLGTEDSACLLKP